METFVPVSSGFVLRPASDETPYGRRDLRLAPMFGEWHAFRVTGERMTSDELLHEARP